MNFFIAMLARLIGGKKKEKLPDYSDRMAAMDRQDAKRKSDQRFGKSQGSPSHSSYHQNTHSDDIMSNPLHPLNPLSPISIYNTSTPSESSHSNCDYGSSSSSSSSSYDSGSSSCDSGSSSSSSD